jgi:hypothetical protein
MQYGGAIYILTNRSHSVLYLGVTSDLYGRVCSIETKYFLIALLLSTTVINWSVMSPSQE